jgi:hypothetical protein
MLDPTPEGNTIVIARQAEAGSAPLAGVAPDDDAGRAALAERAAAIVQAHALPAPRWLKLLRPLIGPGGKAGPLRPAAAKKSTGRQSTGRATGSTGARSTSKTAPARKANP